MVWIVNLAVDSLYGMDCESAIIFIPKGALLIGAKFKVHTRQLFTTKNLFVAKGFHLVRT